MLRALGVLVLVMLSFAMLTVTDVVGVIPDGRGWLFGAALGVMFAAGSVAGSPTTWGGRRGH